MNTFFIWIISIVVVVVLIFVGVQIVGRQADDGVPSISSIEIDSPDLIVHGENLAKVELRAIPTGTEIRESDHLTLGTATLLKVEEGTQVWIFPIPVEPVLATEIYAVGFDEENKRVGEVSLDQRGATAIHDALWGNQDQSPVPTGGTSREVALREGQSGAFGDFAIKLIDVTNDSRCPEGVTCIWAGEVVMTITFNSGGAVKSLSMSSTGQPEVFGGYAVKVIDVLPQKAQGMDVNTTNYTVRFLVTKI
jgi:hypothetical protein